MIFFIFGILALLAAFCLFRSEYKAAAVIPGALAAVLIVISCVSFVPTGYTGIVTTFGKVENGTKDAGVVVKAPWQSIVKMDNRVQEVSIDLSAFSSDIQEVATSVTVGYRINQANAMTIYKEVGRKYEDVLILPRVPEVVKAVVAHYDASSLISNRDAVAEQMDAQLRSVLAQYNIDLSYISITNFDFTDTFTDAVEAKVKAQQEKEKYALERIIFQATDSAQFENYILASAAQQYAEQTADAGSSMALWLDGAYTLYSGLPAALPRTALKQALTNGENAWQLTRAAGRWYLLLTQPLDLPGVRADMLCAYDVSAVFATRDAQLRAWLAASAALLVLGGGAAVLFSRRVTRPLTALQTASEKIADGEYTQRTQVKTDDEIGALSRSFDAMAAAVEGKINELSKTTQSQQDFIAAFTHEVKTPMTAMLGYADLMRARPDDTETQREAAGYIYHETQRLENLSRSLLALMGLDQAGALELVPCQDAGLLLQTVRSLPQGSTPVPRVISAGCVVQVDRSLWVDMLRNLTLNAQRACQGIEGAAITLRCERRAGQAVFTVTDTGCGIPAADLPRVTEAFYMVDKSRSRAEGGSGIGLALCARIANAHGAKLEITSTEHVGTTVTIAVPEVLPSEREADNDTQS